MCALSSSDNVFRLTVKCCCTEPHFYELIRSSAIVQNLGVSTQRSIIFCTFMTMLPPSVQAHKRGPSSHVCGQVYLDLPGSAQISLDMDTKIWEAKFPDLLKRALPRQTPYLSPKQFFMNKNSRLQS